MALWQLLSPEQERALRTLLQVFLEENKKLNLSAYRTEEQCWVGNVLDSVAAVGVIVKNEALGKGCTIVDVGTGGGFPLLPLAILLPQVQFTGLDATRKKTDAVQRMVATLQLANVRLVTGRAEALGHPAPGASAVLQRVHGTARRYGASDPELREQFDFVLCRAVAGLATLLEYCSPFARVGGTIITWKTMSIEDELQASVNARMQLHCRLMERVQYDLDELAAGLPARCTSCSESARFPRIPLWGTRQLLIFEKVKALPHQFPRKVGLPKQKPL